MKKIACLAVLLSTVLSANLAKAEEVDFSVRFGVGMPVVQPKITIDGTYNQGPKVLTNGNFDTGASFAALDINKSLSYSQKLPQIFADFSVKFTPFFALDFGGGYSGKKETNITLLGAVYTAAVSSPTVYPAKNAKQTPTLVNQGIFGRVGANLQWSNSSMFTPFAGAFIGMERANFKIKDDSTGTYTLDKTDLGSKNYTFFGAKLGANIIVTEGGLGISANYLYQRDMNDNEHRVTDFSFKDDAMKDANTPAPNAFKINDMLIKNDEKNKHAFEVAIVQTF